MKATSKIVTLILLIIFFLGLCVLLYPAFAQYWNSKVQSFAVADYSHLVDQMSSEDYTEVFLGAYDYNRRLAEKNHPLSEYSSVSGYRDALNLSGNGIMGVIDIDKIQVELPIYHGTSATVLSYGCGHLEGTSLPVGGEGTHSALSAHRGLPTAKLFTNLDKLQLGDTFTITILDRILTYEVDQIRIVSPTDTSDLAIVPGRDYCTLITCTPYGINTHRLLVRGTRVETVVHKTYYIGAEAYLVDRLIVTPLVALPILFILIVYVIFKPVKRRLHIEEEDQ